MNMNGKGLKSVLLVLLMCCAAQVSYAQYDMADGAWPVSDNYNVFSSPIDYIGMGIFLIIIIAFVFFWLYGTITKPPKENGTNTSNKPSNDYTFLIPPEILNTPVITRQDISPASGTINGREYVDLGLSVKWAMFNVDASFISTKGFPYNYLSIQKMGMVPDDYVIYYAEQSLQGLYPNWDDKDDDIWRIPDKIETDELLHKCKHEVCRFEDEI